MSVLYRFLGSRARWLVRSKYHPLCMNYLCILPKSPLNSRNIFVQIFNISRNLSSCPRQSLKTNSVFGTNSSLVAVMKNGCVCHSYSSTSITLPQTTLPDSNSQFPVSEDSSSAHSDPDDDVESKLPPRKALDEVVIEEASELSSFIDDIGPSTPISFNLAAYVNMSESLQQLVKLGVDLSEIEEKSHGKFIQSLDFERDMKNHIQFLYDVGVPADDLGMFLTKNPLIFKEDLDHLKVRINYLEVKKFSPEAIARIVTKSPKHLSLETKIVDRRLGFLQKTFKLTGNEVRYVITKRPQLVPFKYEHLMERIFTIKEVMGFTEDEMKKLLLAKPKLYMLGSKSLTKRFNIVHTVMGIPHKHILHFPGILLTRDFKIEQRHKFLVKCGCAQYDPCQPNYVSLEDLAILSDGEFCRKCAKTSLLEFNEFLKTL